MKKLPNFDDDVLDGNRLFSRPPLVAHLTTSTRNHQSHTKGKNSSEDERTEFWIIVNHWKSKLEDTKETQYTLPRRLEQAEFVNNIMDEIMLVYPGEEVIVLGDFNDFPDSQPLEVLNDGGLENLMLRLPRINRYTYIFHGVSQVMDHVLIRRANDWFPVLIMPIHINSDYPYRYVTNESSNHRSSDHDPVLVKFALGETRLYLPLVYIDIE